MIIVEKYSSGEIRKSIDYKYFMPSLINKEWIWSDPKLNKLLENASFELGQLNSFAKLVPNVDLFIHLHITKEAVVSCKIEGTQTHFDEAFLQKENVNPERKDDWQEVQNYTEALNSAMNDLTQLPLQQPLVSIKEVQSICKLSPKASGELINTFVEKEILKEFTGLARNRLFVYESYLNLFED